jgi:hypothetical protein
MTGVFQTGVTPATRGPSLSRGARKPQIESVKKNMVIESFESSRESFARWGLRLLREEWQNSATGKACQIRHERIIPARPHPAKSLTNALARISPYREWRMAKAG